jgi:hypothetical protein
MSALLVLLQKKHPATARTLLENGGSNPVLLLSGLACKLHPWMDGKQSKQSPTSKSIRVHFSGKEQ